MTPDIPQAFRVAPSSAPLSLVDNSDSRRTQKPVWFRQWQVRIGIQACHQ
jgi:hypothetical protein